MPESPKHPLFEYPGWADIVAQNSDMDPADFALKMRSEYGDLTSWLAEQLHCYQKAEKKLSGIHGKGWIYRKESLEQSSGTATARYKASLFKGGVCCDLTGGLGIDTIAFAEVFKEVHHIEPVQEIAELAQHNHDISGRENITHHLKTAEAFLDEFTGGASLLYLDPSRREEGSRIVKLSECAPNAVTLWPQLCKKGKHVLVKVSPLYDLSQLSRELTGLNFIKVVSVRGEVKEILAGWDNEQQAEHVRISAVLLNDDGSVQSELHRVRDKDSSVATLPIENMGWVCLPDPAITKARLTDVASASFGMNRISLKHDALGSEKKPADFPGRIFRILESLDYHPKNLQKVIRSSGWKSAHIYRRDFPVEVKQLHKKFGLPMGPDVHLLFVTDEHNNRQVLVCVAEH